MVKQISYCRDVSGQAGRPDLACVHKTLHMTVQMFKTCAYTGKPACASRQKFLDVPGDDHGNDLPTSQSRVRSAMTRVCLSTRAPLSSTIAVSLAPGCGSRVSSCADTR